METICGIPEPVCACVSEKCLLVPRLYTTPFLPSIFPRLPLHILTGGVGGEGGWNLNYMIISYGLIARHSGELAAPCNPFRKYLKVLLGCGLVDNGHCRSPGTI